MSSLKERFSRPDGGTTYAPRSSERKGGRKSEWNGQRTEKGSTPLTLEPWYEMNLETPSQESLSNTKWQCSPVGRLPQTVISHDYVILSNQLSVITTSLGCPILQSRGHK